jgi:nicotinic acid mononucleotide adenylyltransferase
MLNFIKYLREEAEVQGNPLKHLRHVEDHAIYGGHEGISQATEALNALHNHLLGKKTNHTFTDKADGAPSIVYGYHPETDKFFVATKSAFNKNPKINYTDEDIDRNHGHAPGLAIKLKEALKHLPKIMPKIMPKSGGLVVQGDAVYGKGDVSTNGGHHHFTPNLLTYSVDKNSAEGQKVKNSKFGIVTHTIYRGKGGLENMSAEPLSAKDRKNFIDHPDVNNIDNTITSDKINPRNYTGEEQSKFHEHMENARKAYSRAAPEMYDSIKGHEATLEQHINDQVRKGGAPSVEGYTKFLTDKAQKDIDSVKTEKSKQQKHQALANKLKEVSDNRKHFDDLLKIHGHLQNAKNVLLGVHAKNGESGGNPLGKTSINGNSSSGEGIVITNKQGDTFKGVNRGKGGFAQQNLTGGRFVTEEQEVRHVITYGRFNPITKGHQQSVEHIQKLAKSLNAGHTIVMSHSQDNKKNPLTSEQKLKHAKRAFPSANLVMADKEHPTLLHHLSKLHNQGVTHPTIVVGQDRIEDFKKLANKYNGVSGAHGHYNFKHIDVQSSGPRTPGVSGTDMRKFASDGDEKSFAGGAPTTMKPEHVTAMYNDVKNGMTASNLSVAKKSKAIKENVTYRILKIIKESLNYK